MHNSKKRTTVSLSKDLVEKAKKKGINLSQTLEKTLKIKLGEIKSSETDLPLFANFLDDQEQKLWWARCPSKKLFDVPAKSTSRTTMV